jgi:hypothetical protein
MAIKRANVVSLIAAGSDARKRGASTIQSSQHADASWLQLLFAPGKRPTRADMLSFVSCQHVVSLSHDPAADAAAGLPTTQGQPWQSDGAGAAAQGEVWLELLREGLTFDLRGLAGGPPHPARAISHRFDFPLAATGAEWEALTLSAGPHLAGGERSVPVLKGMLGLARDLTQHFEDLQAVFWQPSGSAIGRRFFESVITAWIEGGAFPALGLTAFEETADGALQSVGLGFWIGQELRIEPPLTTEKVAATRLGVRLVNQLVIVGGLEESERIIAPDGTRLIMSPSRNGDFVRVRRE